MKIIYTSDLHIDAIPYYDHSRFRSFLYLIKAYEPDYIIFGGDNCERWEYTSQFFSLYRREIPNIKTALIPGNHDLWSYHKDTKREAIYDHIRKTCKEYDITFLEENPIVDGKILLCGTIGWYDYSAKPEAENTEFLIVNKGTMNNDGNYIISDIGDLEFAEQCKKRLLKNIRANQKNVSDILVFTHVPVLKETLAPPPYGKNAREWYMSNSYFYNFSIGKELLKNKKVKLIISGHVHRYMSGMSKNVHYAVCGSDYGEPEALFIDYDDGFLNIDRVE